MKPFRPITQFEEVSTMCRRIALGAGCLTVMMGLVLCMASPVFAAERTWDTDVDNNWTDDQYWSDDTAPTISDDAIVSSGTVNVGGTDDAAAASLVLGGSDSTGELVVTGGELTIDGTLKLGYDGSSYSTAVGKISMSGGTLNVGSIVDYEKAKETPAIAANEFTMSGGTINIADGGSLNVGSDYYGLTGGCNGATDVSATGGTINLQGDGTLAGDGGCAGAYYNPFPTVSVAPGEDDQVLLVGPVGMQHLITGDGTITGDGENEGRITLVGDGDVWTKNSEDIVLDLEFLNYLSMTGNDVNVQGGDFSAVENMQLMSVGGTDDDTTFVLQDDLTGTTTDFYIGKYLESNPDRYAAIIDLDGNSLSVQNIIVGTGETDQDGNPIDSAVYAGIDASDPGSSISATEHLIVSPGGNLTVGSGVTVSANTVQLFGSLENDGTIDGATSLEIRSSGVLTNNGNITSGDGGAVIEVSDGGILRGSTTYFATVVRIHEHGIYKIGNSPGVDTYDGTGDPAGLVLGLDAIMEWEVYDADGVAGVGWDQAKFINGGTLNIEATSDDPVLLDIWGWTGTEQGDPLDFNPLTAYQWLLFDGEDSDTVSGFDVDKFTFYSHIDGVGSGSFWLSYDSNNGDVYLHHSSQPEPATVAAMIFGGLMVAWRKFRRKKKVVKARK